MLKVTHTQNYNASIEVDGKQVKVLSQSFDENGMRNGAVGEYITDKETYYANLKECRVDEDVFLKQMRDIEDANCKLEVTDEVKE